MHVPRRLQSEERIKVISPDGKVEEVALRNARDLVRHHGYTYPSNDLTDEVLKARSPRSIKKVQDGVVNRTKVVTEATKKKARKQKLEEVAEELHEEVEEIEDMLEKAETEGND